MAKQRRAAGKRGATKRATKTRATRKAASRTAAARKAADRAAKRPPKKATPKKAVPQQSAPRKAAPKPALPRKAAPAPARAGEPARRTPSVLLDERRRTEPQSLRVQKLVPSFTVDDLGKSVSFYVDGLGFHVKERWESDGKLLGVMLVAGASELGLSQDDWAKGRDRKKGIGARSWAQTTQPLEALAARARRAGIAAEIRTEPWGARTLTVTDPDGFVLTLHNDD